MRRLVGTRGPAADLSPDGPVRPLFPNAKLIVQRRELELLRNMHPLQAAWYQPGTFTDLREGALEVIDGDVLLGPGVALLGVAEFSENGLILRAGDDLKEVNQIGRDIFLAMLGAIPTVLLITLFGSAWVASKAIAPVEEIRQAAKTITAQRATSACLCPRLTTRSQD